MTFQHIRADILHAHRQARMPSLLGIALLFWRNPGLQVLVVYRFGRWLKFAPRPARLLYPLYVVMEWCVRMAYDIHLAQSASIAPGLYIGHLGGIKVQDCHIGKDCAIGQQVRIGPTEPGQVSATASAIPLRGPVIGMGVWIGASARIVGDVTIGPGATIGAGAVVTQNIPDRCLVLGNPARIAMHDYDNSKFL